MKKVLFLLFTLLISICSAQDKKGLALVIGNANYKKGVLKNPINDAKLISTTLKSLNFEVLLGELIYSCPKVTKEVLKQKVECKIISNFYQKHESAV